MLFRSLKGAAITWLMNLPEGSISSFEELCLQFVANFKGSYERHLTLNDLRAVRQRHDETLRQYLQRFYQTHHKIARAADADVISAFREGVTNERMLEKLGIRDHLTSIVDLVELAGKCAKAEEGTSSGTTSPSTSQTPRPLKARPNPRATLVTEGATLPPFW